MSQLVLLNETSSACISCKQQKRKCNKALPTCSTCARVKRTCQYSKAPPLRPRDSSSSLISESPIQPSAESVASISSHSRIFLTSPFADAVLSIDPYGHDSLQQHSAVNAAICRDALELLGNSDQVKTKAGIYFDTLGHRIPFIWKDRFDGRLHSMYNNPHPDFSLLCLCIHLAVQKPPNYGKHVQSSIYAIVKGYISLLEASGFLSLEFIQARILVSVFEMGHGLYPAASISISACARTARALGLNKKRFMTTFSDEFSRQRAEEEKRVWWEIVNLDRCIYSYRIDSFAGMFVYYEMYRFINLCIGDALFSTEDPSPEDKLPVSDKEWVEDTFIYDSFKTMATPSEIGVSPFARECQIAHLLGRVLRHVFEPASDATFHNQEYNQLENTLTAFFTLLIGEQHAFVDYCASLSMCSCAAFLLYDSELLLNQHDDVIVDSILSSMETTASRLVEVASLLFSPIESINMDRLSPYVFYSLYQAATVHQRKWKLTKHELYKERVNYLKTILGHFNTRWRAAGIYLDGLDNLDVSFPITLHSMQGASVGTKGPSREVLMRYRF